MQRPQALTEFFRVVHDTILARAAENGPALATARRIFSALEESMGEIRDGSPQALPACHYLDAALANARGGPSPIPSLADAFRALVPLLSGQRRAGAESLGPSFYDGHANTYIIGPNGLERRGDVIAGASLLAPNVTYPDHSHPPEEIYIVMSEGDWFGEDAGWYTPGIGGIVYHAPLVTHAMRSGPAPLLAIWCLWSGE